jgi:hypothetical protein
MGYENGAAKLSLYSNENNYLKWDGTKLLIKAENFNLSPYGKVYITNGALSLGNPPPVSSSGPGYGIWLDKTGLYGINNITREFYLQASDGKAYAGAGVVVLDSNGISITAADAYMEKTSYTFKNSLGNIIGALSEYTAIPSYSVTSMILENSALNTQNTLALSSLASSGYESDIHIVANNTTSSATISLSANIGLTSGIEFLSTSVDFYAPVSFHDVIPTNITISNSSPALILNDTTASAKSLTMITDSNLTQLRESSGADGSLLVLDFAKNSMSLGTATSIAKGLTVNEAIFAGSSIVENNNLLSFAGPSGTDRILLGDVTEVNNVQNFSISTWVNQTEVPSSVSNYIFYKQKDTSNRIYFATITTSNRLQILVANGSTSSYGYLNTYQNYITAGRWHHVVVVYDGTQATNATRLVLYIDGVAVPFTGFTGTIPDHTADLSTYSTYIGLTSSSWYGKLKRFRMYSSSLTSANVTTLYQGTDFSTNLVHYYKLDEGYGTTANDTGSNPLNGAITGATWITSGYTGLGTLFPTTRLSLSVGTTREDGLNFGNDTHLFRSAINTLTLDGILKTSGRKKAVAVKTGDYTVTANDEIIACNSTTTLTITLPAATGSGQPVRISNINTGTVTIDGNTTDTVCGSLTQILAQWDTLDIVDYASGAWV